MTQEIEIEYKNLLTKQEFNNLLDHLPFPADAQKQTNYYFETKDFSLKENGCALRIREKEDTYHLTLKEPHPNGLLETHDILTKQEAMNWIKGKNRVIKNAAKSLKQLQISPESLIYYGSLITERRELKYREVLLVLDYSIFNGKSDYELELEAPNEEIGLKTFERLLTQFQIPNRTTPNKIQRFFSSL
ncbi:CYTH domain-containing protein [Virgibacillus alimentarius]|uniref:Uncharacterized protein YjbK n=1 Tax=Virgibacillus alimentarius TaxID=698769 RepID=A0ABS4S9T6_9BACI|nr:MULTISPECIES: CYTH domain-containing protein [Virgibacillus]MBP2258268.1 uncharacterized protein YjbK [Virgibacillus alimentarius]HLR65828.1 CYTH domain-containing protein [Virgibacillus sp.]